MKCLGFLVIEKLFACTCGRVWTFEESDIKHEVEDPVYFDDTRKTKAIECPICRKKTKKGSMHIITREKLVP